MVYISLKPPNLTSPPSVSCVLSQKLDGNRKALILVSVTLNVDTQRLPPTSILIECKPFHTAYVHVDRRVSTSNEPS
jgi:hypothetical protein